MAIFGIGAHHKENVARQFIESGVACVGWTELECPPAHAMLRQLRAGDVIYIKSFTPKGGLTIKAVGLVTEGSVRTVPCLGKGVNVHWIWQGLEKVGKLNDKWPVRSVTLYEEQNPKVQEMVLNLLLKEIAPKGQ